MRCASAAATPTVRPRGCLTLGQLSLPWHLHQRHDCSLAAAVEEVEAVVVVVTAGWVVCLVVWAATQSTMKPFLTAFPAARLCCQIWPHQAQPQAQLPCHRPQQLLLASVRYPAVQHSGQLAAAQWAAQVHPPVAVLALEQ